MSTHASGKNIQLSNGGTLAYSIYGTGDLKNPVLYHHGFPGSRLEGSILQRPAMDRGLTIIAVDRPGIGKSTFDSSHSISTWPSTAVQLLDHLNVESVRVMGVSGGGPYALSCAAALGDRIKKTIVISSMAPLMSEEVFRGMHPQNKILLNLGRNYPQLAKLAVQGFGKLWKTSPQLAIRQLRLVLPKSDRELLRKPEFHSFFEQNIMEALQGSTKGAVNEFLSLTNPWGFDLGTIHTPTAIWHGIEDSYVPPAMGEYLHRSIKDSEFRMIDEGGHLMAFNLLGEMLEWLRV